MEIGLYMNTHGLGIRDERDWWLQPIPATTMKPVEMAQLAERSGFHSLWFSDHVAMPPTSAPITYANPESGKRHYPPKPDMLDGAVVMGAVAAATTRIKMSPSVLISPYRPPMSDARQFATVDHLSNGRLIMGVGAGWSREEFAALGLRYEDRSSMLSECIEIYKRAWDKSQELVTFHGKHYNFDGLSMDPKPVQDPYPPIVVGGMTPIGARAAAQQADGFYPIFLDPKSQPRDLDNLQDLIRREAALAKRDLSHFYMFAAVSARITKADDPHAKVKPRPICGGTVEQVLADLQGFAAAGYSLAVVHLDCPTRTVDELKDRIAQFGQEIIPAAKKLPVKGEWKKAT